MNHPITYSPAVDRVMSRVVYLEERRKLQQAANRAAAMPLPFMFWSGALAAGFQFWASVFQQLADQEQTGR
jgi:hypothetical protein